MRRTWTAADDDTLRAFVGQRKPDAEIAKLMDVTRGAVSSRRFRLGILPPPRAVGYVEGGGIASLPGLSDLAPVVLKGPPAMRRAVTANAGVTIVAGDFQFPCNDLAANAILLETIREMRPSRVVLNGDLPDMLAISKYPKDARPRNNWTLQDEEVAMKGFLRELERVLPKDCEVIETESNHSGNGTGSRWWRFLSDRGMAPLLQMDNAEELLSYQKWWYPKECRIALQDTVMVSGLLITHGEIVRKFGGYSARAHGEKYQHSVMHSHTHRQGMSVQRVPAVGRRAEGLIRTYEIGCQCKLELGYATAANWTQGFSVIVEDGDDFGVELVTISSGAAAVCALGKTVRAA